MNASVNAFQLHSEARRLRIDVELHNNSRRTWTRDEFFIGYQLFDPETDRFIREGQWTALERDTAPGETLRSQLDLEFGSEPGAYRVYVSPISKAAGWAYQRGARFLIVTLRIGGDALTVEHAGLTTKRALRWRSLRQAIPKAFQYPFQTLVRNRRLIRSMARRDILARYRGSFGDVLWTILNPLLLMGTYFFVFGVVLHARFGADQSSTGFALYFLAGMLPWLAFSEPAGRAPHVVLEHRNFVKKLIFPIETLPVNQVVSGFITELFALAVFMTVLLFVRGAIPITVLWLPVLIVPQLLFTLGVCWFLAALGAYLRDLGQIMGFLLTLWFFVTPICYPETSLPKAALPILGKNPIYILVRGYRAVFLERSAPEPGPMLKLWLLSLAVFLLGHAWFYKLRKTFADVI